jgi:DNA-binding MarR family transcriptional regulator
VTVTEVEPGSPAPAPTPDIGQRRLLDGLAERGLAVPLDGASGPGAAPDGIVHLTSQGEAAVASLVTARRMALAELIKDWNPDQHAELAQLLTRLARSLTEEPAPAR